jgi:hypothetical protein
MRPVPEQQAAALAKARGITIDEARELLKSATKTVAVRPSKGH